MVFSNQPFNDNDNIYTYGKLHTHLVPFYSALLALGTIAICYVFAVSLGHVQPWPNTDITHCGIQSPERYFFRIGMIPACVFLMFSWYLVRSWIRAQDKYVAQIESNKCCATYEGTAFVLGFIGSWCLVVSSSVLEQDDTRWTIHVFCATTFFILTVVAQLLVSIKLSQMIRYNGTLMPRASAIIKLACNALCVILLLLDAYLGIVGGPSSYSDAIEWFLVGLMMIYFMTFSWDWIGRFWLTAIIDTSVTNPPIGNLDEQEVELEQNA
eukprot:TRINITY_DN15214_c0_g1_i1.p1 TRINITY_DN15214_c0_g1~~TRINITY_DN15214_c0_g1_i1.p1  ORF type:complete len:268 (+),score=73.07 TRINITY_DN15214_c0_g1_i1:35-838(+)